MYKDFLSNVEHDEIACTAHGELRVIFRLKLKAGHDVLVLGAGGVPILAVQLARQREGHRDLLIR